jgi:probable F420-dependent oxidoreductase
VLSLGVVIPSYGVYADGVVLRDLAQAAEDLGYDDAWFADHVVIPDYAVHVSGAAWLEPLACCFLGLGATRRLRFGTDVLVAPYRNPVLVAKMAASADRISGGRLILGLGVGYIRGEFEALGAPDYAARGAVTDEYIDVMRALWSSDGACSFHGTHVRFDDVHFAPTPTRLPIWVGGNGARALTRAAQRGDGWHPLFPTPEVYAAGRARIEQLRGGGADFSFSYSCPLTRILDAEERLPETQGYEGIEVPAEFGYAPPPPRTADGRLRFVGHADELREDLEAFEKAGVEHLSLRFWTTEPDFGPDRFVDQLQRFMALAPGV